MHTVSPAVLPNGRLPTLKRVIEYFYYLRSLDSSSVEYNVTFDLINHWIKCNVYTQTRKSVQSRLTAYFDKLKYLKDYPKNKKKDTYWKQYSEFVSASKQLFDIIASNDWIKAQEKLWKVKMIEADYQFHRNMLLVPQDGYCSSTDKQWKHTEKIRTEEDKQLEKRRQIAEEHERTFLSVSSMEVSSDFVDVNIDEESDKEFSDSEESIKSRR